MKLRKKFGHTTDKYRTTDGAPKGGDRQTSIFDLLAAAK
jgi:hypothetical protein